MIDPLPNWPVLHCVFCGRLLPTPDDTPQAIAARYRRRYCSASCNTRENLAIAKLRDTSPAEVLSP